MKLINANWSDKAVTDRYIHQGHVGTNPVDTKLHTITMANAS